MNSMAKLEALRAAHRELVAAYEDLTCALGCVRGTYIYEELLPVLEELDEAFQRFLAASEPFISTACTPPVEK